MIFSNFTELESLENGKLDFEEFNFNIEFKNFFVPLSINTKDNLLEINNGNKCINNDIYLGDKTDKLRNKIDDMYKTENKIKFYLEKIYKNFKNLNSFIKYIKGECVE